MSDDVDEAFSRCSTESRELIELRAEAVAAARRRAGSSPMPPLDAEATAGFELVD
jgi:hypothetical protein